MAPTRLQALLRRPAVVAALAAVAAAAAAGAATPAAAVLPAGARCSVSGSRIQPEACGYGLTCILDNLGQPEVDRPDSGVCTTTPAPLNNCTVFVCAAEGAAAACRLADSDRVTTCGVYSRVPDVCPIICTQECREPPLCSSDGKAYCNPCILAGALCDGGFKATGPVDGATCSFDGEGGGGDDDDDDGGELDCTGEISPFDAPRCCTEKGVGCITEGAACTNGALIPGVPCADGLVCVITDLGNLPVDVADSGTCEKEGDGPLTDCSTDFCEGESGGSDAWCNLGGRTVTCEAFAKGNTDIGGPGGGGGGGELDCTGKLGPFDAPRCCTEQGVGCIKNGGACTSGALIPAVPCADGLTCVIFDVGNLPVDQPDAGSCEALDGKPPPCTAELCAKDAAARCASNGRTLTCAAFVAGVGGGGGGGPVGPGGPGGPVVTPTPNKCDAPNLDVLARGRCCREQQKACAVVDESCCVGGNCGIVPPVPCAPGLVCVGEPPVDGSPSFGQCGYNCKTKEVWTPAKSEWCCRVEGAGCPFVTPTPKPYNCLTEEVWSADKMAWCCANKKLGCGSTPASKRCDGVKYTLCRRDPDCADGEACVEKRHNKPASCALRAVSGNHYCTAVGCNEGGSGGYGGYGGYYRPGARARMGHCSPKLG